MPPAPEGRKIAPSVRGLCVELTGNPAWDKLLNTVRADCMRTWAISASEADREEVHRTLRALEALAKKVRAYRDLPAGEEHTHPNPLEGYHP